MGIKRYNDWKSEIHTIIIQNFFPKSQATFISEASVLGIILVLNGKLSSILYQFT